MRGELCITSICVHIDEDMEEDMDMGMDMDMDI